MSDTLNDAAREYIEFVIRLKMQEVQQGLQKTGQEIGNFDKKARDDLGKTGKAFDELDRKGK
ncbi:MAG: hypothetical protein ACAI44_21600, partial [Candidatus Sericytochromatia bacterium]